MFRCEKTGRQSEPGEASRKLVTKTRKKEYFREDPKTGLSVKVGEGWEIVEELTVCEEVYKAANPLAE